MAGEGMQKNDSGCLMLIDCPRRIDHIKVADAWTQLEGVAAEEGLVGIGYQRAQYGAAARVYQFAKLYLYSPAASVRTHSFMPRTLCIFPLTSLVSFMGSDAHLHTQGCSLPSCDDGRRCSYAISCTCLHSNHPPLIGTIEVEKGTQDSRLKQAHDRLTSLDPKRFWTSGQWVRIPSVICL